MDLVNRQKCCRLCLCSTATVVDVFKEDSQGFSVKEAIKDLIQIEVKEETGLCWFICPTCLVNLGNFRLFKLQCQESNDAYTYRFRPHGNTQEYFCLHENISVKVEESNHDKTYDQNNPVETRGEIGVKNLSCFPPNEGSHEEVISDGTTKFKTEVEDIEETPECTTDNVDWPVNLEGEYSSDHGENIDIEEMDISKIKGENAEFVQTDRPGESSLLNESDMKNNKQRESDMLGFSETTPLQMPMDKVGREMEGKECSYSVESNEEGIKEGHSLPSEEERIHHSDGTGKHVKEEMAAGMSGLLVQFVAEEVMEAERPPRMIRERKSPFHLEERNFIKMYRVTKELAADIIRELTPFLKAPSRSSALTPETKVFAALRLFAGGPYQSNVGGEKYTGMDQSSVSRCLAEVTHAINTHLFDRWVFLDLTPASVAGLREKFHEKYGFPGVIGAIDCTHVAIVAPPANHPVYMERQYFNHNRYHSINVQLVCDSSMKILNVNARYPGATHDAYIYANSALRRGLLEMKQQYNTNAWLIGDSGYPLETILLTPVMGEVLPNSPEERYNRSLCQARSVIEQCNGLLKSRWRCLLKHRVLHYLPERASDIINSCCVLHNMCLERNVPAPEIVVPNVDAGVDVAQIPQDRENNLRAARILRQNVIEQYFT